MQAIKSEAKAGWLCPAAQGTICRTSGSGPNSRLSTCVHSFGGAYDLQDQEQNMTRLLCHAACVAFGKQMGTNNASRGIARDSFSAVCTG